MRRRRALRAVVGGTLAAALLGSPATDPALPALAAGTVKVTKLSLPLGSPYGGVEAINDRGEIVGGSTYELIRGGPFQFHNAEYWSPEGLQTNLNPWLAVNSGAWAINRNGLILGGTATASVVWVDRLPIPMAPLACVGLETCTSGAVAINDNDQVAVFRHFLGRSWQTQVSIWQNGKLSPWGSAGEVDGRSVSFAAMNSAGTIIGLHGDGTSQKAFMLSGGTVTDLPSPGWPQVRVMSINDQGQVLGEVGDPDLTGSGSTVHSVVWQNGQMTDLGTLGGKSTWVTTDVYLPDRGRHALNDQGQVVGISDLADGTRHAFLWQNGQMTDLGIAAPDPTNRGWYTPYAINDHGQFIGWDVNGAGFLWQNGSMTWFPRGVQAYAINNNGMMAGEDANSGPVRITLSP